jgi:hypothetical protein
MDGFLERVGLGELRVHAAEELTKLGHERIEASRPFVQGRL